MAQSEAKAAARDRMQHHMLDPDQPRTYIDVKRATDIFSGQHPVPELKDTHGSIGWLGIKSALVVMLCIGPRKHYRNVVAGDAPV